MNEYNGLMYIPGGQIARILLSTVCCCVVWAEGLGEQTEK